MWVYLPVFYKYPQIHTYSSSILFFLEEYLHFALFYDQTSSFGIADHTLFKLNRFLEIEGIRILTFEKNKGQSYARNFGAIKVVPTPPNTTVFYRIIVFLSFFEIYP